jgi:hypothetical protein
MQRLSNSVGNTPLIPIRSKDSTVCEKVEIMNAVESVEDRIGTYILNDSEKRDTHFYLNHINQEAEQITREPFDLPILRINDFRSDITKWSVEDFTIQNYQSHPSLKHLYQINYEIYSRFK